MLAAWLVVLAAGGVLATQLDGALSGGGFTNPRAEALIAQKAVQDAFGDQPNQLIIVLDGSRPLGARDYSEATALIRDSGADAVTSPSTNTELVSKDRSTAVLLAGYPGDGTTTQNLVPYLQRQLEDAHLADDVYVTGQPALDYQLNAHSKDDATRAEIIVFPLLIIVLLVVFGSLVAALLPLLVAGTSLAVASGIGFVATQVTDVSNLYSNIVSMIGLAVAVDYSLFIVKRFREELAHGEAPDEAVVAAMQTAGKSVLYSAVAVVLALGALFIPQVMALTSIALGGIVVTVVALAVTVLVLPVGLVLLGHRVNKMRIPLPTLPKAFGSRGRPTRHPGLIGLAGIVLMLAAAVPIAGITLQSPVASATVLPVGDPARTGLEVLQHRIEQKGLFPIDVVLTMKDTDKGTARDSGTATSIAEVDRAVRFVEGLGGVDSVTAVTTLGIPRPQLAVVLSEGIQAKEFGSLWHRDTTSLTTRLLVNTVEGPDSVQAHDLVRQIRQNIPTALETGTRAAVTGPTAQGLDFDDTIRSSIPLIAAFVLGLTYLLLAFAFRSLLLPGVALMFNVLVVGASLGLLTAVQRMTSDQPLNSVTPVLLFAVMFGLSMDYLVIIISRMRESYLAGMTYDDAVLDGARRTRTMINSAAVIMVAVFCSFMTGQISIVREIGIGLAIAVALDAILIRMIVMPSILRLIGSRAFGRRRAVVGRLR